MPTIPLHLRRPTRGARNNEHSLPPAAKRLVPLLLALMLLPFIAGVIVVRSVVRHQVHCDDGTVWVTSTAQGKAMRFNADIEEPTAVVAAKGSRFDIVQSGDHALLTGAAGVSSIDASTLDVAEHGVTERDRTVLVGGGTVALLNRRSGNVYAGSMERIGDVTGMGGAPSMRLGDSGKMTVDHEGTVWGYRPGDGMVLAIRHGSGGAREVGSLSDGERLAVSAFTVVDGVPVVLSGNRLIFRGGETSIDSAGNIMTQALLQATPTDDRQSGWVALALPGKLVLVDLRSRSPKPLSLDSPGDGTPAQPVSTGGCVHAAYSQRAGNFIRVCSPTARNADFVSLAKVSDSSELVFRANHRHAILNDTGDGTIWNPRRSPDAIAVQWNAVQPNPDTRRETSSSTGSGDPLSPDCASDSSRTGHIRAMDDEFGIRASSRMTIDVLRNDENTGCSALHIDRVGAPTGGTAGITPVLHGRYLQVDASEARSGTIRFTYDISDGHGQTATASVRLNIVDASGDHAPQQIEVPADFQVEQDASYTVNALESFADPDGDPLTLVSAAPRNGGESRVSARADGRLTFHAGPSQSGRIGVDLTVSNGTHTGTGTVFFAVHAADSLPARIDPVSQDAVSATPVTLDLSPYIHATGASTPSLDDATAPEHTTVSLDGPAKTLTFTAATPGTYHVPFTVTQGKRQSTGSIRFTVSPPTAQRSAPIAANDAAVPNANGTAILEPLANDIDPMGGVLSLTSVTTPPGSAVTATTLAGGRISLTAKRQLSAPVAITYTVANAVGSAKGTIIMHPNNTVAGSTLLRADDFTVPIRCGGTRTVDVLDHVQYDDDAGIRLDNTLHTDESFQGTAYASEHSIRYQAPEQPGEYSAIYTITNDYGETISATITFNVHRRDADGKKAAKPRDIQAHTRPGGTIRIPITLTGIDDSDDAMLLGLGNETPQLGRIIETDADSLTYEAYDDANGTDTFSYAVEDWSGRRSQATIRIGITRSQTDSGITARDDSITVRPGTEITVPVTANDTSREGTELTLDTKLDIPEHIEAHTTGDAITVNTPNEEGTHHIIYTVRDQAGFESTATLTVQVKRNAAIQAPQANDYRIPAHATLGKRTVTIDIGAWIANPSGPFSDLAIHVDGTHRQQTHVKGTTITLNLAEEAYTIPYTVTNTTHGTRSTAFIHVPAYGAFPPTNRPDAPELNVPSGTTITIALADHIRVGAGKQAYIDAREPIKTTKGGTGEALADRQTIRFTAPADYAGPASLTLTATDARPEGKTPGTTSVIMLPITITGKQRQPPTFPTTTVDMAPGDAARIIDLNALATGTAKDTAEERLTYSGGIDATGVQASVSRSGRMRILVADNARPGSIVAIPFQAHTEAGTVDAGLNVRIVASSRPLARIARQTIRLRAGETRQVDILADAYNPFPETPLAVTHCGKTGDAITLRCDVSGTIEVSAARSTTGTQDITVTVEDATHAADRTITGMLRIVTANVPDAPSLSAVRSQPQDGAVTLLWTPGRNNGGDVIEYEVNVDDRPESAISCGTGTVCTIDGLANGRQHTFTVRARNDIGWSPYSNSITATPDTAPEAPVRLQATGGRNTLDVAWQPPSGSGTAFSTPTSYIVTLDGTDGTRRQRIETSDLHASFPITDAMLSDSASFTVAVRAVNGTGPGKQASLAVASGEVYGEPERPSIILRQDGTNPNLIKGSIEFGDMRGNRCQSVVLDRQASGGEPTCTDTSFELTIADGEFFFPVSVAVIVRTNHGLQTRSAPASITPTTPIGRVEFLKTSGSDGVCSMRWRVDGKADSVTANLHGMTSSRTSGTLEYVPDPWTPCETGTVTPSLNGEAGATMISPADSSMLRPAASIAPPSSVRWDGHDHIIVRGGHVDTYGQPAAIRLTVNGVPFAWTPSDGQRIDVSALPQASSYRWAVQVTGTGDSRLNAEHKPVRDPVDGSRAAIPSASTASPDSRRSSRHLARSRPIP